MPKNTYRRNSPLLNVKILNKRIKPANSQKHISSIQIMKSAVLKLLLIILNMSNSIPITTPVKKKQNNVINSSNTKSNHHLLLKYFAK